MGADNHLTTVPRQLRDDDGDGDGEQDDNQEVTSNYGVVRGHGSRTAESPDESGNEVLA